MRGVQKSVSPLNISQTFLILNGRLYYKNQWGGSSKGAIYAALFGNLGIAISKLVAAILTGSTSMWAETYHSFSDTFNQVLLLAGIRTRKKQVSEKHPFGHGKEQFFWSFIVATLIFGISGVMS